MECIAEKYKEMQKEAEKTRKPTAYEAKIAESRKKYEEAKKLDAAEKAAYRERRKQDLAAAKVTA